MSYDTGNFREGKGLNFTESPAANRGAGLPTVGSISYTAGWITGLSVGGTPFWEYQDYDMFLNAGNNDGLDANPSTNPIITGLALMETLLNPVEDFGDAIAEYNYAWYSGGGTLSVTLQYQDWLIPGTWTFTFEIGQGPYSGSTNTAGTVDIYAVGLNGTEVLLLHADSATNYGGVDPSPVTFDSTSELGAACVFRIKVVQTSMTGDYSGITWEIDSYYTSPPPLSTGSGLPPQGIVWSDVPVGTGGDDYMQFDSIPSSWNPPGFTVAMSGTI